MQFDYRYLGSSAISSGVHDTAMSFVPDASREPTFFRGALARRKCITFREAISALHKVVISDQRYQPKDRSEYMAWLAEQEQGQWEAIAASAEQLKADISSKRTELRELRSKAAARRVGFEKAKRKYFNYLYRVNMDAWWVLDPVITVHPDEIFFECFSQDESSYGRLGCNYEIFGDIGEFACGTTNIDYSQALYNEFQKIRDYKETSLEVEPGGFQLETEGLDAFREVKIDLPDTWVRGFLQVSSAMTFPARSFELHPLDVYNLCTFLRRHKEKHGPRSMRYRLRPGEPVRVSFDPWGTEITCHRSIYHGSEAEEIRVWGRRRIHILERLIPIARKFTVHLLGRGQPSFYVADLGDMNFTLGLSGWTRNDWSGGGNFDLLAPRTDVDDATKQRVFAALKDEWRATPDELSSRLGLSRPVVLGALASWTQAGRVMYDLENQVYRARELSRDPLPADKLRFNNPREEAASRFLAAGGIRSYTVSDPDEKGRFKVDGTVFDGKNEQTATITIDADDRLLGGTSSSGFFRHNKMTQGPCEIMIALRLHHSRQSKAARGSA